MTIPQDPNMHCDQRQLHIRAIRLFPPTSNVTGFDRLAPSSIRILRSCESVVIPSFSISSHRFSSVDIEGKINIIRNQLYTWRQLSIVLDLEKMQQPTQAVSTTQGTQPVATFKVCFKPFATLQSYWFFLNRLPLFNVNCSYNSLFLLVTVVQGRQRLLNAIWQENSRKNMLVSTRRA